MSRGRVEYKRFLILIAGTSHERYVVEIGGEWFHFKTLDKAKEWIDFVAGKPVNYNSNVTC